MASQGIQALITRFRRDDLIGSAGLLITAGVMTAVFNYLFHVLMGRFLDKDQFAEFGALFGLSFYLSFILITTIRVAATGYISEQKGKGPAGRMPAVYARVLTVMTLASLPFFGVYFALSWTIADFLHIDSVALVWLAGLVAVLSFTLPVNMGALQGLRWFRPLAASNVLRAGSKFAVGVVLVIAGLGVLGSMIGLVFGMVITLAFSFVFLGGSGLPGGLKDPFGRTAGSGKQVPVKSLLARTAHILIAVSCLTFPTNLDVVLVKHMFTTEQTALFTAAAVFGKVMFFIPVGIVTVMYPLVVETDAKRKRPEGIFVKSMLYTIVPCGAAALVLFLFPGPFLKIVFGGDYADADSVLRLYSIVMLVFSMVTVFAYYYLARGRLVFIYLFAAVTAVQIGLVWVFHDTPEQVLGLFLVCYLALLAAASGMFVFEKLREPGEEVKA